MDISEPRLRTLLRQAQKVAESGKRSAAEKLYRQIIAEAPDSEAAWLGLGDVLTDKAEKAAAYEQALLLDPGNQAAGRGLAELRGEAPTVTTEPTMERDRAEVELSPDTFDQSRAWLETATARQDRPEMAPVAADPQPVPALAPVVVEHEHDPVEDNFDLFCYRHPGRKTSLRCYSCGRPICSQCAKPTPVGYRCPQCIREAEEVFFTATALDYVIAFVVALPLSAIAGYFVPRFGFFVIFVAALAGTFIGDIVWRLVRRRRGRWLPHLVVAAIIIGGLPAFLFYGFLWPGLYLFLAVSAAYYRLR
jgi:hypothetical protein